MCNKNGLRVLGAHVHHVPCVLHALVPHVLSFLTCPSYAMPVSVSMFVPLCFHASGDSFIYFLLVSVFWKFTTVKHSMQLIRSSDTDH